MCMMTAVQGVQKRLRIENDFHLCVFLVLKNLRYGLQTNCAIIFVKKMQEKVKILIHVLNMLN